MVKARPTAGTGQVVTTTTTVPRPPDMPRVRGWVYGPHTGRRRYIILVRRCCHCEYAHRHTSEVLAQVYIRRCLVTGRSYVVRTVVERDTARARGGGRRGA